MKSSASKCQLTLMMLFGIMSLILVACHKFSTNSLTALPTATFPAEIQSVSPTVVLSSTMLVATGVVTGQIYYPSEFIPAMTLFLERIDTHEVVTAPIAAGQRYYTLTVSPGTYHAYAWGAGPRLVRSIGAFTACRPNTPCEDHTFEPVTIAAGQTVTGVDIYDWYAQFPLPPGVSLVGTIEGLIFYPGPGMPAMTVYARNAETGETFSVSTQLGQFTFRLENLPIGSYYVFAWIQDGLRVPIGGAYACLLSRTCADHSLINVPVRYNEITRDGVKINDWFDQASVPEP